ncbi:MAG: hypothetical protein WBF28_05195 [Atribacterota bacterium]
MNKKTDMNNSHTWYFYNWTLLGWLETVIKAIALFIGIRAFRFSLSSSIWSIPSGIHLFQWILLGILTLGIFFAIFNRWQNKEISSMIFVLFNNLGHWGMLIALTKNTGWETLPVFAFLMMLGDLVKITFLKQKNYTEKNIPASVFVWGTLFFAAGYALIGLLTWFD